MRGLPWIGLLALLLAACGGAGRPEPSSAAAEPAGPDWDRLTDSGWRLVALGPPGVEEAPPEGVKITLDLAAEGKLSGHAGCNRYFGTVGSGPLGSTKMACAPPQMEWEDRYLAALSSMSDYELEGGQLRVICDEGRQVLTYTARSP